MRDRDRCFKLFITPFFLGPMIVSLCILLTIGFISEIIVLLYFSTFGWLCELGICESNQFLVKGLTTPWKPLLYLLEKICDFYSNPLIK